MAGVRELVESVFRESSCGEPGEKFVERREEWNESEKGSESPKVPQKGYKASK